MKKFCFNTIFIFINIFFNLSIFIYAQDSNFVDKDYLLEEIVVSSNKLNSKLKDVSSKIELITKKQIVNSNALRLPDLLRQLTNINIKGYGITPQLQSVSVNGLGSQHTLILIDGVKINSFQNSQVDLSILPLNNVKQIEFINNGVSSIYGSDAIGGLINIITNNRPKILNNKSYSTNLSFSLGSFNTKNISLGIDHVGKNYNLSLFYNIETSDGNYEYIYDFGDGKRTYERKNAQYNLYDLGLNSQFIIRNNTSIRLLSNFSYQNKNLPGIVSRYPSNAFQKDEYWNNIIILNHKFSRVFMLKSTVNFQNSLMKYNAGKYSKNTYKNIVASGSSELRFTSDNFKITSGYHYTYATAESKNFINNQIRNQHAIFIASRINLIKNLRLFPSLRYDNISDIQKDAITYKIGLNYQPISEYNFGLRGNAGKNFRAPSFNDLYWITGGNSDLHSEYSTNYEAGFFYFFNSYFNGKIDLSYTHILAKDKIIWLPGDFAIWTPKNIESSVSKNITISLALSKSFSTRKGISVNGDFSFIDSRKTSKLINYDAAYNKQFPYIPFYKANLNTSLTIDNFSLNVFYRHTGTRYSDSTNKNKLKKIDLVDLNVQYSTSLFSAQTKLKFDLNNLFNFDYEIISGYPMPLRNFRITLTFTI